MPSNNYQPVIVSGINSAGNEADLDYAGQEIVCAHAKALTMFEDGLVTALSPIGHNSVQSFAVLPNGSGNERKGQMAHRRAVTEFTEWLCGTNLDYVAVGWGDELGEPSIIHSHEDRYAIPKP